MLGGMKAEAHTCRLPFWRIPLGKIITCPECGRQWIGDRVEDIVGEPVADWTPLP